MKCSECGQILGAEVAKCANCGTLVNATLVYREVDAPVAEVPAPPAPAVVDLTDLDVVDLRELIHQLHAEPAQAEKRPDPAAVASVLNTESIRQAWEIQRRNSAILWPQKADRPRPTFDDITPGR